ncbi:hypothetical protein [Ornithinibacillus californiensis]|uniref:hypothetical protein n=1 Tax=Ornithinibacillus californiensis TaxID=161536 RepID=UPI00064D9C39|nr:hypothetical protein [Ornithinibacillus californiensis]
MISANQLSHTKEFLLKNCRQLEITRFEYLFEDGSKDAVIRSLKEFQNDDGGFGHGIEPDFWLPSSSPMATWAAGQILKEIEADKEEPMVKSMVNYLINTFDHRVGKWASILEETNNYPHAPWWHWTEGVQDNWSFNPSIELAANLIHWSNPDSKTAEIGWKSIKHAVTYLMNQREMDKHEINNFQQFIKIIKLEQSKLEALLPYSFYQIAEHIMNLAFDCINKDKSSWGSGYEPLPLDFVQSPSDALYNRLDTLVEQNLDFYLSQMLDEGTWDISWEWGSYPQEFEVARTYWKGILAVDRLKQFRAFGYLEEA